MQSTVPAEAMSDLRKTQHSSSHALGQREQAFRVFLGLGVAIFRRFWLAGLPSPSPRPLPEGERTSVACLSLVGRRYLSGRFGWLGLLPPHPGPLPWGEGGYRRGS